MEAHATDPDQVRSAVEWALRTIGQRNAALRQAAVDVATRLSRSKDAGSKALGKNVLRDLAPRAREDD